ncbi:MAG: hypothetical protein AMXMBFR33_55970 [Candidatus Xenobia bacterium]
MLLVILILIGWLALPGMAEPPTLILQDGHTDRLTCLTFDPTGRWLATGSVDQTVKLWDLEADKLHCTIHLEHDPVALAFNPGGLLAVGTSQGVTIYDARNGLALNPGQPGAALTNPAALAFLSPDLVVAITGDRSGLRVRATLADLKRGGRIGIGWPLPSIKPQARLVPAGLALSPDGKYLAMAYLELAPRELKATDRFVAVWDVSAFGRFSGPLVGDDFQPRPEVRALFGDGQPLARMALTERQGIDPSCDLQLSLAFSPDSRKLAVADLNEVALFDPANGSKLASAPGAWRRIAWGQAGILVSNFLNTSSHPRLAWLGSDLKTKVLVAERESYEGEELARETMQGAQGNMLDTVGYNAVAASLKTSLFAVCQGEECELWDGAQLSQKLTGRSLCLTALALSPDHRLLAVGGYGAVVIWDLERGKPVYRFGQLGGQEVLSLAFSADGRMLAAGEYARIGTVRLRVWELPGQSLVLESSKAAPPAFTRQADGSISGRRTDTGYLSLAFSPDGRWLAAGEVVGRLSLIALPGGQTRVLKAEQEDTWRGALGGLAFSPDGRRLASATNGGEVVEWEVSSGKARTLMPQTDQMGRSSLAFARDGTLVTKTRKQGLVVWKPGAAPRVVDPEDNPSVLCSADSGTALLAQDRVIEQRDLTTGKTLFSLTPPFPTARAFLREGVLIAPDSQSSVGFWRAPEGKLLASAIMLDEGAQWLVAAPDGLFDGSSAAFTQIQWRLGGQLYALDQFYNDFFAPGLLTRLLQPGPAPRPAQALSSLKVAPPELTILKPQAGDSVSETSVTVEVKLEDRGGGVSQVRLFQNGHRVPDERIQVEGGEARARVDLEGGLNTLRATAFDREGKVESRGDTVRVTCLAQGAKPRLHVLAVGVSRYRDSALNLRAGRADAESIARAFKPGGLFEEVKVTLLVDEQASAAGVRKALEDLKAGAAPQDTLLVFLAGHGQVLGQTFYFVPHEGKVATPEQIQASCLSSVELAQGLTRVAATRQFVVLDCCHSGAAATSMNQALSAGLVRAQQDLARQSGVFLVAAASSDQAALEAGKLEHGLLTYSVLNGLGDDKPPGAPVNSRGLVTVNGLLLFVSGEVPRLAEEYFGQPQDVVQYSSGQDFPLRRVR